MIWLNASTDLPTFLTPHSTALQSYHMVISLEKAALYLYLTRGMSSR
jgi:hypothetical protein